MSTVNTQKNNLMSVVLKLYTAFQGHFIFITIVSSVLGFIMPVLNFIILMGGLVVADTISGTIAALRMGANLESRKAYRTLEKLAVYSCAILGAHGINLVLIAPMHLEWLEKFTLVDIAAGSICFTEFLSLRENIQKITGVDVLGGFKKAATAFMGIEPSKSKDNG